MNNPTIAVVGATGSQGGSVVRYLKQKGPFKVRALLREGSSYDGPADEAVVGNLDDVHSMTGALEGAYGVFVVTNFWQEGTNEIAQAENAIQAARTAGVSHFVWSSLPNVEAISSGKWTVPHFTDKAKADAIVATAGFPKFTITQPAFYFENFVRDMAPTDLDGGAKGWVIPIDPDARVIHMATISEYGRLVAAAFSHPEAANGQTLSMAAGLYSFNDIAAAFSEGGEKHSVTQAPLETYENFYPGADEIGQMLSYFQDHTYMGPGAQPRIDAANDLVGGPFTTFADWLAQYR